MRAVNGGGSDGHELSGLARPGDGEQGFVSRRESIGSLAAPKRAPLRYGRHPRVRVRVEQPLQPRGSSAFGSISRLCADQTAPPFHAL